MKNETLSVPLSGRSYDICIGDNLLEQAGQIIAPFLNRPKVVVVTDENVLKAQGARLRSGLEAGGIKHNFITLQPGEATKSFQQLEQLTGQLLDLDVERTDVVIAFGGGVVGDITGFASAILRRGCNFIQIPTTLLAQVDSAVGGKTAVNVPQGKNLIGAFHQPAFVMADISTLETLPARELRAGYAEIVKYGLISDPEFFDWLDSNHPMILEKAGHKERAYAVKKSCAAKAKIVAQDEREKGERALLNLGHTFGHAFEAAYGYSDSVLHGEAVALGMALAFDFSTQLGLCPSEDTAHVKTHLRAANLPTTVSDLKPLPDLTSKKLLSLMMQDKKMQAGEMTLILASGIGKAIITNNVSLKDLEQFLEHTIAK
ncbi:MAG: 3-dehydroquinate synthase [Hyphococcus sp.]|nr:MAG: 3-dehydroquinate synthase [Marinicaulis sp.]